MRQMLYRLLEAFLRVDEKMMRPSGVAHGSKLVAAWAVNCF
jgi:hypothetical protein